jgi:hemerythrin superfamily protein
MPQVRINGDIKTRPGVKKARGKDAIELLKADHRDVEALFASFEDTESAPKKKKLAAQICKALRVHAQIEEEIFYPACREAGVSEDLMDEADIEHDAARKLIADIEAGGPGADHWDARVKVLSEMIEHHVRDEEQRDGVFSRAKKAGLDLEALAAQLQARKAELMKQN